jgi:hypothetical protein
MKEGLVAVESAYNLSWEEATVKLPATIDRLMWVPFLVLLMLRAVCGSCCRKAFAKPAALFSFRLSRLHFIGWFCPAAPACPATKARVGTEPVAASCNVCAESVLPARLASNIFLRSTRQAWRPRADSQNKSVACRKPRCLTGGARWQDREKTGKR